MTNFYLPGRETHDAGAARPYSGTHWTLVHVFLGMDGRRYSGCRWQEEIQWMASSENEERRGNTMNMCICKHFKTLKVIFAFLINWHFTHCNYPVMDITLLL